MSDLGDGVRRAVANARAYVAKHGDADRQAYAAALCGECAPDRARAAARAAADAPAAAEALERLAILGEVEGEAVEIAAGRLAATQAEDGSWQADAVTALELTARCAAVLACSPCARPSTLARASAWLDARFDVDAVQAADAPLLGALFAAWARLPTDHADEALQWCGRELERGYRTQRFDALAVARVFVACGAQALPAAALTPEELCLATLLLQEPDGGFPGADPDGRLDATLAALEALLHFSSSRPA